MIRNQNKRLLSTKGATVTIPDYFIAFTSDTVSIINITLSMIFRGLRSSIVNIVFS